MTPHDAFLLSGFGGPDDDNGINDEPDEDDENEWDTPLLPPDPEPEPTKEAA